MHFTAFTFIHIEGSHPAEDLYGICVRLCGLCLPQALLTFLDFAPSCSRLVVCFRIREHVASEALLTLAIVFSVSWNSTTPVALLLQNISLEDAFDFLHIQQEINETEGTPLLMGMYCAVWCCQETFPYSPVERHARLHNSLS